jgi:hypothetical protein
MKKVISAAAVAITLAFSPLALAKLQSGSTEHLSLGSERGSITAETFSERRHELVSEIETGETYAEISSMQKRDVIESLDRMGTWLESAGSVDAMSDEQRIRLFNEQEKINTMLTGVAADSRMVCTREQTVGTRMRQTTCFSVAERRRRREADTEDANRWFQGAIEESR